MLTLLIFILVTLALLFINAIVIEKTDSYFWPIPILIIYAVIVDLLLYKTSVRSLWAFVCDKPYQVLAYVGIYLVIGVVWSFFKWNKFSKKEMEQHSSDFYKYSHEERFPNERYVEYMTKHAKYLRQHNVDKITAWMAYWPFSIFHYLFADILLKVFKNLSELFGGVFDKIVNRHTNKLVNSYLDNNKPSVVAKVDVDEYGRITTSTGNLSASNNNTDLPPVPSPPPLRMKKEGHDFPKKN